MKALEVGFGPEHESALLLAWDFLTKFGGMYRRLGRFSLEDLAAVRCRRGGLHSRCPRRLTCVWSRAGTAA